MSDVVSSIASKRNGITNWEEELQRKIFLECADQIPSDRSSDLSSESQEISEDINGIQLPVSKIIKYIHKNLVQLPHFRNDFLDELRKPLEKAANRNEQVGWKEFREASRSWFVKLVHLQREYSNSNNASNSKRHLKKKRSDSPNCSSSLTSTATTTTTTTATDDSEKETVSSSFRSISREHYNNYDSNDNEWNLVDKMDMAETIYSINSSNNLSFGLVDGMIESSDISHDGDGDIASIDLNIRIRKFNEENLGLKEDLLRCEEVISALEQEIKSLQQSLEHMTNKYTRTKEKNENLIDLLAESERKEETCKLSLEKIKKSNASLEKKAEQLDKEKRNCLELKEKINDIKKENAETLKQLSEIKIKFKEKCDEYENLEEGFKDLKNQYTELQESFNKNIMGHEEKIKEFEAIVEELQKKLDNSSSNKSLNVSCDQFSFTPPPYNNAQIHSTPYSIRKIRKQDSPRDSLFAELKASGEDPNELRRKDMITYNEEMSNVVDQVDEALQIIASWRKEIHVPNLQLVEQNVKDVLKEKVKTLLNFIKSLSSEISMSPTRKRSKIFQNETRTISEKVRSDTYNGNSLKPDPSELDLISSIATLSISESSPCCQKIDRSTSPLAEPLPLTDRSDVSEEIIPIVNALNKIIEIKNNKDDSDVTPKFTRAQKQRTIFTTPSADGTNINTDDLELSFDEAVSSSIDELTSKTNYFASGDGSNISSIMKRSNTLPIDGKTFNIETKGNGFRRSASLMSDIGDNNFGLTYNVDSRNFFSSTAKTEEDVKSELYITTPKHNNNNNMAVNPLSTPRRKFSVYQRSFDINTLQQTSNNCNNDNSFTFSKKRSISSPDVQDNKIKHLNFDTINSTLTKEAAPFTSQISSVYRENENIDSTAEYSSSYSSPNEASNITIEKDDLISNRKCAATIKPVILQPKLKLPATNVVDPINITKNNEEEVMKESKLKVCQNNSESNNVDYKNDNNVVNKQINDAKKDKLVITVDSTNENVRSVPNASDESSAAKIIVWDTENKTESNFPLTEIKKDEVNVKIGAGAGILSIGSNKTEVNNVASAENVATVNGETASVVVDRTMSSGEDTSDSESDRNRTNSNSPCTLSPLSQQIIEENEKVEVSPEKDEAAVEKNVIANGHEVSSVTSNQSVQKATKEDETPVAFPNWSDDRLRDAGIANFADLDTEISEHLTEEELKKKCVTFSVGLGTDRMTLSKRINLSRRQRDQAEKNFNREVEKIKKDMKDIPRQRNSLCGKVPGVRRPSLCYESQKWENEQVNRTESSSNGIAEIREIFEHVESRRPSREENNNNLINRNSTKNLVSTFTSENAKEEEEDEMWTSLNQDTVPEPTMVNEINSLELRQNQSDCLIDQIKNKLSSNKHILIGIFIAFILGYFLNSVVSSAKQDGPPPSWWSLEEIFSEYLYIGNKDSSLQRPI